MTTAIILAGGLGTRLREIVSDRPKPMALIAGEPFLKHLLDYWICQGITQFILSIGYKSEIIQAYFGSRYRECEISYVVEDSPLGTGGGLLLAISKLSNYEEPFLLLNGDTFFAVDLENLLSFHNKTGSDCTFSLFRANEDQRYMGMKIDTFGKIEALYSEKGKIGELANGGVYLINALILFQYYSDVIGQSMSLESDIFYQLLDQEVKIYGAEFNTRFIDIGLPYDYIRASAAMGLPEA